MKFRSLACLSCFVFLRALASDSGGAPAQEGFIPAKIGEGPLVFFIRPEDDEGRPQGGGGQRTEVMYVCDPTAETKAVPVWRNEDVPVPVPLQRLTKDLVAVERRQKCFVWDLAKGTAAPLWPGGDQTSFLHFKDGKIFFLQRLVPQHSFGMKLDSGNGGKTVAKSWFRARDRLFTLTPGGNAQATEPAVPILELILEAGAAGIFAVTADEPRKLCLIADDGKVTDIVPFDSHWVAPETKATFSPARDYVALSILTDEQDIWKERERVVVDVKRKTICHLSRNVPVGPYFSNPPPLHMVWLDETHLLVDDGPAGDKVLDVQAGKLSPPTEAQKKAASRPESPAREKTGLFETAWGKVWFPGDAEPAGLVLDESGAKVRDMEISKDGKWAVFCGPDKSGVFLLDGKARAKHRLLEGWCYNITWLPGVEAVK